MSDYAVRERTKIYERTADWRANNPDKIRNSDLKKLYGITLDEYNAMSAAQGGKCCICEEVEKTLCVDHDHKTGKVRALLCKACNVALGMFKDDVTIVANAARYLDEHGA
jgi:hypothetical protein